MTLYTITFDAPAFSVSSGQELKFGFEVTSCGVTVSGVGVMAAMLSVNGPPVRLRFRAYGALPKNNPLPVPPGTVPTWSGFNEAVATYVMDADSLGVTLTPIAEGAMHISATVEGFMPAAVDVTVGPEKVDHFEIVVE